MLKKLKKLLFLNQIDNRSLHHFDLNENKISKQFIFLKIITNLVMKQFIEYFHFRKD